ncbi:hypothetical protein, partial [Rhodococcus sp. BP22]|uniref:hypothetical protein n=1 Tax=Rhodococcus sp. BP22 TaxID=2758566 RepID=UPI001C96DFC0
NLMVGGFTAFTTFAFNASAFTASSFITSFYCCRRHCFDGAPKLSDRMNGPFKRSVGTPLTRSVGTPSTLLLPPTLLRWRTEAI